MQESEEQDTCRICSAPAEPDQPLFHPCKCSGTIRYIHQDCLTTWLAHSKKKTCDVCKHPYSFTKVYAPDMPSHIPPLLLMRRLLQQLLFGILFALRAVLVAVIWLAVLPWVTVWTWRMYFAMGESTAWWISNRPRPPQNESTSLFHKVRFEGGLSLTNGTVVSRVTNHPAWVSISADIFAGQIIAALIVLTFVAVFLLREWISQNARPGLFEEDELIPEDPVNLLPPPPEPLLPPQPAEPPEIEGFPGDDLARRQHEAIRVMDAFRLQENQPFIPAIPPSNLFEFDGEDDELGEGEEGRNWGAKEKHVEDGGMPKRARTMEPDLVERMNRPEYKRRVMQVNRLAAKRRIKARRREKSPRFPHDNSTFNFTFQATPLTSNNQDEERPHKPAWLSGDAGPSSQPASEPMFFPPVSLQPPNEEIPFSLRTPTVIVSSSSDATEPAVSPQRPSLPPSILPSPSFENGFAQRPSSAGSPGLAIYRAPEEILPEAGPSRATDYFSESSSQDQTSPPGSPVLVRSHSQPIFSPSYNVIRPSDTVQIENELGLLSDSDETDSDVDEAHHPMEDALEHPLDFLDEDEDEDDMQHFFDNPDEGRQRELVQLPGANGIQAPAPPAGPNVPNNPPQQGLGFDGNEEIDGNVEDDMEGAMEAIGMRGPLYGVLQNAALMVFVLDTAIGCCIWIPFTIGKTMALLSLDPHRIVQLIHLPIKAMRLITDPIVDLTVYVINRVLLASIKRLLRLLLVNIAAMFGKEAIDNTFLQTVQSTNIYLRFQEGDSYSLKDVYQSLMRRVSETTNATTESEHLFPEYARPLEPYFEVFGRNVRVTVTKLQDAWIRLALGAGPAEKVFAVFLGYVVFGLGLAFYLNVLTVGNARTAGRAVRNVVRQQLLVVKVAGFIFIELVVFPFACGTIIDVCTVWLFTEATIQSRLAFFGQAPLTAVFYHWVAGTMFMYSFAVLLSGCRSVVRPGAMWFIKDPQDQNAHPIRDILERPALLQLRKICVSAVLYSVVVICSVGSVAGLLLLGSKSIMPFRWKNREPLSHVPVDLLFLHLVLPQTLHYFRPRRGLKALATIVWRYLAEKLRLTSYFFGGRYPSEEYASLNRFRFPWSEREVDGKQIDGTFRRVPATDHLALPREMRATVQVDADGDPVDDEAARLMNQQNAEAHKAKHDIEKDYMVVFIPTLFRYRIIAFILFLWTTGALFLGVSVALPIQLGRSFFTLITNREVHDGYSFIVGFYSLWACYLCGRAIDRLDKQQRRARETHGGRDPRGNVRIMAIKRSLFWASKMVYIGFFLGIVVPVLVAFVVDLYILLPIRSTLNPGETPRIRVVDAWALGLLYAKIGVHILQMHPPNIITQGAQRMLANGWAGLDPIVATREVIAPLTGGLLAMIIFPAFVLQILRIFFPALMVDTNFMFMNIYPAIFMLVTLIRSCLVFYDIFSTWSQSIRDKEFLVELKLKNHDPEPPKSETEVGVQTEGDIQG